MSSSDIRRFKATKKGWRTRIETQEEEIYFADDERLDHWKKKSLTVVHEESPPAKQSTLPVIVPVCAALLTFCSVCWMYLEKMGPDPQASGSAMAQVIAALGTALGVAGILGAAIKLWRDRR